MLTTWRQLGYGLLLWLAVPTSSFSAVEPSGVELEARLHEAEAAARPELYLSLVDYYRLRTPETAVKYARLALADAAVPEASPVRAGLLAELAYAYNALGQYPAGLRAAEDAARLAQSLGRKDLLARAYTNAGSAYYLTGIWDEALERYLQARALYEAAGDLGHTISLLNNIANVYTRLKRYDEAIALLTQALDKSAGHDDALLRVRVQSTLGDVYRNKNDCKTALLYLEPAMQALRESGRYLNELFNLRDYGYCLGETGQVEQGLQHLDEALELARKNSLELEVSGTLLYRARLLLKRGREEEAARDIERGLAVARQQGRHDQEFALLEVQEGLMRQRGLWAEAQSVSQQLLALKDVLFGEKTGARVALLQVRYETERKEHEISLLKRDNELKVAALERQRAQRNQGLLLLGGGFLLGLLLLSRYVHRRELKRERELNEQLRRVDVLKDQLLSNTSHELRTPLNGIIGLSDYLLGGDDDRLPDMAREQIGMIAECGRRLSGLVTDILDFAQLKDGRMSLQTQAVDLHRAVQLVVALHQPQALARGLRLVNAVPLELPSVLADPDRLQQILHNLVGNAVKFTLHGSVRIDAQLCGAWVELEVSDTGPGIAAEQQARLLEYFEQGDASLTRRQGGAGLGLAITRKLVELHGGRFGLESAPGEGSRFRFMLPVALRVDETEFVGVSRVEEELSF